MMLGAAFDHALSALRGHGELRPYLFLASRRLAQVALVESMPPTFEEQATIFAPLRIMVATTPAVEAYWLAAETWIATVDPLLHDEAIQALEPRQREDRREGVINVQATRTDCQIKTYETTRDEAGAITGLVPSKAPRIRTFDLMTTNLFEQTDELGARIQAAMMKSQGH